MAAVIKRVDLSDDYAVDIKAALNRGRGKLLSLSAGGAHVATAMTLLPQAQVRLKIVPPGAKSGFVVVGVVNWEKRGENWRGPFPAGYGVRFTELDSAAVEAIRGILESAVVPPIEPPSHDTKSESSGLLEGDTTATIGFDARLIPKERGSRKGEEEGARPCPTCGK